MRVVLLVTLALLGLSAPSEAGFYLVPICTNCGMPPGTKPKYFADSPELVNVSRTSAYYDTFAVVSADLTPDQHNFLVSQPDVLAAESLDTNLTKAQAGRLQSYLASHGAPSPWVSMVDTYRSAFRRLAWMGQVMQLFHYRDGRLFSGRIDHRTRLAELHPDYREWFVGSAAGMQLTVEGLTDDTTLEEALKFWSDQRSHVPFQFSGGGL